MNEPNVSPCEVAREDSPTAAIIRGSDQRLQYYDGPIETHGDVHIHGRFFTSRVRAGLVAGTDLSLMFTIDGPARQVWPHFKDFNLWQSGHYYSGVVGDLEGRTFRISLEAEAGKAGPHQYKVLRVVPEYLIVIDQPVPEYADGPYYEGLLPGIRGVSPGFHVFSLTERDGKTIVTVFMYHAALMQDATMDLGMSEDEALRPWRERGILPEGLRKWRDEFIPKLKRLVNDRN